MPNRRKVALLVAVATALYGIDARADDPPPPPEPKPKTVEEIVKEARERVENKYRGQPASDWKGFQKIELEEKKETKKEPMAFYLAFGASSWSRASLGELRGIRADQRNHAALDYAEQPDDFLVEPEYPGIAVLGVELNRWLDMELTLAPINQEWEINDGSDLRDAPGISHRTSTHHSYYRENSYALTFLPRWDVNKGFAVFARVGVGYANSSMGSTLSVQGRTGTKRVCNPDPKDSSKQECYDQAVYDSIPVEDFYRKKDGFYPIVGVGVDIFQMIRLDYTFRTGLPLQGSEISTGKSFTLNFYTSRWGDGSFWAF